MLKYLHNKTAFLIPSLLLFFVLSFSSCNRYTEESVDYLNVVNPTGDIQDDSLWNKMMYKSLRIDSIPFVSIVDYTVSGSCCFIMGEDGIFLSVDLLSGEILLCKKMKGRARNEFISPSCITSDSSQIYVFDEGKMEIVTLNKDFTYNTSVSVPYLIPSSFIKVDKGFLCYQLGNGAKCYYVNDVGKLKYEKCFDIIEHNIVNNSNVFVKDEKGDVYVKGDYSDTIYVWSINSLKPSYILSYGEKKNDSSIKKSSEIEESTVQYTRRFFVMPNKLLTTYRDGRVERYCLYDKKSAKIKVGKPPKKETIPFNPEKQFEKVLIRLSLDDSHINLPQHNHNYSVLKLRIYKW